MLNVLLLLFSMNLSIPTSTKDLTIEIDGIKNNQGYILVALFNQENGFPDTKEKAFRKERVKASKGKMTISFKDLPHGNYAFGVIHDENDNQTLDTGLFGIPKEGFCFSNQAMGTFGPPSFSSASFKTSAAVGMHKVKMSYW